MYDIQFIIPISASKEIYKTRIDSLKKYGILNVKNNKVLLTLLVGTETIPDLDKDWNSNITVECISSVYNYHAQKLYDYLSSLKSVNAKWIAKIDDDSFNDVDSLISNLETHFQDSNCYICSCINNVDHIIEKNLLIESGYSKFLTPRNTLWHEWEASFLSKKSLEKIISCEDAMLLMKKRSKISSGVTDACFAYAAKIAGIHPVDCHFSTKEPLIAHFSYFGGVYSHIHYMYSLCSDNAKEKAGVDAHLFASKILDEKYDKFNYNKLIDKQYVFCDQYDKVISLLTFKEFGLIKNNNHENESLWFVDDKHLEFYNTKGTLISRFMFEDIELNKMKGWLLTSPENILYLKRVIA